MSDELQVVPPDIPWSERPVWKSVDCSEGWMGIITSLIADLKEIYPDYRVSQIKEKFGTLRFYYDAPDLPVESRQAFWDRIRQAELESSRTCEICGLPGETRTGGWVRTLCDECEEKRSERN